MPDIRYVVLSDLHLGEEESLLTALIPGSASADYQQASPVLTRLATCLRQLLDSSHNRGKPTLILAGDVLELALAETHQALMVFERLLEQLMPEGGELFSQILVLPGNHDHHLWEVAREAQYLDYLKKHRSDSSPLKAPWHVTRIFQDQARRVNLNLLTAIARRKPHLSRLTIRAAYPNLGILGPEARRMVIIHHGHFVESFYKAMSLLKTMLFPERARPTEVWQLEGENFAWIDFLWSALGRSGEVGDAVQSVYEHLLEPDSRKALVETLAANLAEQYDLPGWGDAMERRVISYAALKLADRIMETERKKTSDDASEEDADVPSQTPLLSNDAEAGLKEYLEGPLRNQLLRELGPQLPPELTFVFGHTHKPFTRISAMKGYAQPVRIYNLGGWVVDYSTPTPSQGAAMVLISDELDTLSVRLFNEASQPSAYHVRVEEGRRLDQAPSPFFTDVVQAIQPAASPWRDLSLEIAREVTRREATIQARKEKL